MKLTLKCRKWLPQVALVVMSLNAHGSGMSADAIAMNKAVADVIQSKQLLPELRAHFQVLLAEYKTAIKNGANDLFRAKLQTELWQYVTKIENRSNQLKHDMEHIENIMNSVDRRVSRDGQPLSEFVAQLDPGLAIQLWEAHSTPPPIPGYSSTDRARFDLPGYRRILSGTWAELETRSNSTDATGIGWAGSSHEYNFIKVDGSVVPFTLEAGNYLQIQTVSGTLIQGKLLGFAGENKIVIFEDILPVLQGFDFKPRTRVVDLSTAAVQINKIFLRGYSTYLGSPGRAEDWVQVRFADEYYFTQNINAIRQNKFDQLIVGSPAPKEDPNFIADPPVTNSTHIPFEDRRCNQVLDLK